MTLRWGIWWNFFLFFVFKSSFCYTHWAADNLCLCGSSAEQWRARLLRRKLRCGEAGWGVGSDVIGRACLGIRGLHPPWPPHHLSKVSSDACNYIYIGKCSGIVHSLVNGVLYLPSLHLYSFPLMVKILGFSPWSPLVVSHFLDIS